MKIKEPDLPYVDRDQFMDDLDVLLHYQNTPKRPCTECKQRCSCSGSVSCTCDCHAQCPQARTRLSIDGDLYPIEYKIVELVYVLNSLQGVECCWSCEGHMNHENKLWKIPQVWFYSMARAYLELISAQLDNLYKLGLTKHAWCINPVTVGQQDYTTYNLHPDLNSDDGAQLIGLQQDVHVIAQHMSNHILQLSKDWRKQTQVA